MNLFQSVLKNLSDGVVKISDIAINSKKSQSSIRSEINRLKQVSHFGRWITYDKIADSVRLAKPLRGIGVEALEFMVKQFYNSDRKKGKKFHSHHIEMQDYSSNINDIDKFIQNSYDDCQKLKEEDNGILTI
jgi:archaellum component FlaC